MMCSLKDPPQKRVGDGIREVCPDVPPRVDRAVDGVALPLVERQSGYRTPSAAWAAASRATGTRNGEQLT